MNEIAQESGLLPEPVPALRFVFDVVIHPARAFKALAERGSRGWLLIAIFVLIFTLAPVWAAAPIMQQKMVEAVQTSMEQFQAGPTSEPGSPGEPQPRVTPPPEVTRVVANPLFTVVIPSVTGTVVLVLAWLVWAGVLHLLAVFFGGRSAFKTMFAGVVSASLPDGFRGLVQTLYILTSHKLIENPGLSGLVPLQSEKMLNSMEAAQIPLSRIILHNLLGKIDIFLFWRLFLLGLAVWATAQLSKRRAYILVVGVWILFVLLSLIPAIVSYTMFQSFATMGG